MRRKFLAEADERGLALIKSTVIRGIEKTTMIERNKGVDSKKRAEKVEVVD